MQHIVLAVNKMDLIDWDQERYTWIRDEFHAFAARLDIHDVTTIPMSALHGDNVVTKSDKAPWYDGPPLLILRAHLRRGSLRVQAGDSVEPGIPLGEVGHSGNSSEPHLHIHAQRSAGPEAPLDADPVPMSFGDLGQLVRNQRFTIAA